MLERVLAMLAMLAFSMQIRSDNIIYSMITNLYTVFNQTPPNVKILTMVVVSSIKSSFYHANLNHLG